LIGLPAKLGCALCAVRIWITFPERPCSRDSQRASRDAATSLAHPGPEGGAAGPDRPGRGSAQKLAGGGRRGVRPPPEEIQLHHHYCPTDEDPKPLIGRESSPSGAGRTDGLGALRRGPRPGAGPPAACRALQAHRQATQKLLWVPIFRGLAGIRRGCSPLSARRTSSAESPGGSRDQWTGERIQGQRRSGTHHNGAVGRTREDVEFKRSSP